jgi:hypothetical protein
MLLLVSGNGSLVTFNQSLDGGSRLFNYLFFRCVGSGILCKFGIIGFLVHTSYSCSHAFNSMCNISQLKYCMFPLVRANGPFISFNHERG